MFSTQFILRFFKVLMFTIPSMYLDKLRFCDNKSPKWKKGIDSDGRETIYFIYHLFISNECLLAHGCSIDMLMNVDQL